MLPASGETGKVAQNALGLKLSEQKAGSARMRLCACQRLRLKPVSSSAAPRANRESKKYTAFQKYLYLFPSSVELVDHAWFSELKPKRVGDASCAASVPTGDRRLWDLLRVGMREGRPELAHAGCLGRSSACRFRLCLTAWPLLPPPVLSPLPFLAPRRRAA